MAIRHDGLPTRKQVRTTTTTTIGFAPGPVIRILSFFRAMTKSPEYTHLIVMEVGMAGSSAIGHADFLEENT